MIAFEQQLKQYKKDLEDDMYKDAEEKYNDTVIKLRVSESCHAKLVVYLFVIVRQERASAIFWHVTLSMYNCTL